MNARNLEIIVADFKNDSHARDMLRLLGEYAEHDGGGAKPLSHYVKENLAATLSQRQDALTLLAYSGENAVGLANCFEGFSTFACRPLLNVHDLMVTASHRRQGICQLLLDELERISKERGYCKLTLEVLRGNQPAIGAYRKFGFALFEFKSDYGEAVMMEKKLA